MDEASVLDYYTSIEADHRKKYGQFFTENRVARFMVNWVLKGKPSTLYDPAFGLGAFYFAAKETGFHGDFFGAEIDAKILSHFYAAKKSENCSIELSDYLSTWGNCHSAIICNPPYQRFQKFEGRELVFQNFRNALGVKLSGYTNISSAFLIKSVSELKPEGRLAFIMPLEFLNTGYGTIIKQFLLENGSIQAIIKIECEREVFPDATTSVGIIFFEKTQSNSHVNFYVASSIDSLNRLLEESPVNSVACSNLRPNEKWLNYFESDLHSVGLQNLVPISSYGSFSRGIATGANEYFALPISHTRIIGLRSDEFVPCITKSVQVKTPIFTQSCLDLMIDSDAPVLLLNIKSNPSIGAKKYLDMGENRGYQNRYLTKTRKPWYKMEKRSPSPLWFGVFSRDGFKVVRNRTTALTLTCFHGFTPNIIGSKFIDHLFLFLLSKAGRTVLSLNMRKYGDALDKFEPNDLNNALCPCIEWLNGISITSIKDELSYVSDHGKLSDRGEALFSSLIESTTEAQQEPKVENNSEIGKASKAKRGRKEEKGVLYLF
jgi:adenine-specific DNA-methyltransferase